MKNLKRILLSIVACLISTSAQANICGTDFQSFNPTTNGLDFVTVQSSETLRPCYVNMGLFVNYAVNSLTYNKTLNANYQSGQQRSDRITGMDLSIGTGINDRWDFGLNIPFIIGQSVDDDLYVDSFKTGATEIKANTKYRLVGDQSGGVAAIASVNQNLIENNPFAGVDPGLTWNFELAADTVIASKWAAAVNFGYRKRNPGEAIPNLPFIPMGDQWTYSVAGSYLLPSLDTKVIAELYGSRAAEKIDPSTDRALNSFEGLLGVKHDYSQSVAMHLGATKRLDQALGGAEWRVYAGLNWVLGPVCKTTAIDSTVSKVEPEPEAEVEVIKLNVAFLFEHNSDIINPDKLAELDSSLRPALTRSFKSLVVEGHTDSVGSAEYNLGLSQRRANFISRYLIESYKIDQSKVEAIGFGDTKPIADNGNFQGRQQNRRVDLKILRK